MASHTPDATSTVGLTAMLDGLSIERVVGFDGPVSEYGIPYRTLRAISRDPASLIAWAQGILGAAITAGATTFVAREAPYMTNYESKRQFQKGIVMRFHVLPLEANESLPVDSDGGPAKNID